MIERELSCWNDSLPMGGPMSNPLQVKNTTAPVMDVFQRRHLESTCPVAVSYFAAGLRVLDVGCGPGSMTVDLARIVHPGSVVGIDLEPAAVERARSAAGPNFPANVSFEVGDIYKLHYEDNTFDVAFCINVIEYLRDPVAALRELSRVTKANGQVIMVRMQDFASIVFYPPLPTWHRMWADIDEHLDDVADVLYYSPNAGSRLFGYYKLAGMQEIKITGFVGPDLCIHAGTPQFEATYNKWKTYFARPKAGPESPLLARMRKLGVWTEPLMPRVLDELEAWHNHPHAFEIGAGVCAAARPCR